MIASSVRRLVPKVTFSPVHSELLSCSVCGVSSHQTEQHREKKVFHCVAHNQCGHRLPLGNGKSCHRRAPQTTRSVLPRWKSANTVLEASTTLIISPTAWTALSSCVGSTVSDWTDLADGRTFKSSSHFFLHSVQGGLQLRGAVIVNNPLSWNHVRKHHSRTSIVFIFQQCVCVLCCVACCVFVYLCVLVCVGVCRCLCWVGKEGRTGQGRAGQARRREQRRAEERGKSCRKTPEKKNRKEETGNMVKVV